MVVGVVVSVHRWRSLPAIHLDVGFINFIKIFVLMLVGASGYDSETEAAIE